MEKMTMAENSKAKTSVWWDIENCEVPKGWDAHGIAQNVASALLNMNYSGTVSILAYGDTNLIPHHVQQALSSTGVGLHHVPAGVKDASDKKILVDMLLWAVDNPAPANIMLISGDRDFSNALHQLSMRRYTILLAQPPRASAPLVSAAKNVWLWTSLASGGPPLTSGEESSQSSKPTGSTSVAGDSNDHKTRDNHVPRGATGESVTSCDKSHTSQCYKAHDSVSAKPIHEADVVEPVLCTVCKISCSSKEAYANHIYSKKHRNNLELQSGKVENVSKKKARGGGRTRPNAGYACRLCNVKCQTQVVYDSHLKGQKHAAMLSKLDQALTDSKKLQEKGVGEKSKPRGVSPETQLQSQNTQGNTKWLEKQSKELRELLLGTSESSVKEKLPRTQEPALTVNKQILNEEARECSEGAADNYSREMKKKQKEVMEHRAITPISKLCHLCVVICDSQGVSTLVCDSKHHWTNQKDAFVASDDAVWCSLCQISFNNKAAYANHTNGKKHLKKLKLQSAENENMSKGQAKTSEDNAERMKKSKDQTTFDSQNLKDQTEELKEILLGTSERSVKENLPRTKDQGETVNKQILNEEARECFVEVKKKQKEVMECQAVRVRHKLCHQCVVICDSQGVSTRVCGKKYHWPNQMKASVDSRRSSQELDTHKLREESDQGAQGDKEEVKEINAVSDNLASVFNGLNRESRIHRESRGCLDVIPERVQVPPDESEHKQEREKECGKESKKVQVDSLWTRLWLGKT